MRALPVLCAVSFLAAADGYPRSRDFGDDTLFVDEDGDDDDGFADAEWDELNVLGVLNAETLTHDTAFNESDAWERFLANADDAGDLSVTEDTLVGADEELGSAAYLRDLVQSAFASTRESDAAGPLPATGGNLRRQSRHRHIGTSTSQTTTSLAVPAEDHQDANASNMVVAESPTSSTGEIQAGDNELEQAAADLQRGLDGLVFDGWRRQSASLNDWHRSSNASSAIPPKTDVATHRPNVSSATLPTAGVIKGITNSSKKFGLACKNLSSVDSDASSSVFLTADEVRFARCPPGNYLGLDSKETRRAKNKRLQAAMCVSKSLGWRGGNPRETDFFRQRGYATFESRLWPKPSKCKQLPDESWSAEHGRGRLYRPDATPKWVSKLVNQEANLEFHQNWKVASTSFPSYLRCNFGGTWKQMPAVAPATKGSIIAAAVREPIGRFISGASELLARALSHWCPTGPCGKNDSFVENVTVYRMRKQTTWLGVAQHYRRNKSKYIFGLVKALVFDTGCNYYHYACEHLNSQSNFVTQNEGIARNISVIVKLEDAESGLLNMSAAAGVQHNPKCKLTHANVKDDKPIGLDIPSSEDILQILEADQKLLRRLCLIYAQDFVCFDYDLPPACHGMF